MVRVGKPPSYTSGILSKLLTITPTGETICQQKYMDCKVGVSLFKKLVKLLKNIVIFIGFTHEVTLFLLTSTLSWASSTRVDSCHRFSFKSQCNQVGFIQQKNKFLSIRRSKSSNPKSFAEIFVVFGTSLTKVFCSDEVN